MAGVIPIETKKLPEDVCNSLNINKDQIYNIRAHHALCLFFFRGKGYSSGFIKNMTDFKNILDNNPLVRITGNADAICSQCPNNINGRCTTEDKVSYYDSQVLLRCSLSDGSILPYQELRSLILHNIILPGKREEICGDCSWTLLCHNPVHQE